MKKISTRWGIPASLCGLVVLLLSAGLAPPAAAAAAPTPRVGVVLPSAQLGPTGDVSGAMRESVMTHLKGSGVDAVALEAVAPEQADAEAKAKGCTYVLYTHVEQKHAGGSLFSKLAPLAGALPLAALAGHGGGNALTSMAMQGATNAATSAATSAAQQQAMAQMSGAAQAGTKRGDAFALDYRLVPVGASAPLKAETLQGKADGDGQDVLSPMIERLAGAVSTAAQSGSAGAAGTAAPPAGSPPAADNSAGHKSMLGGLFGHHNAAANEPASAPSQEIDCAKMASMPNSMFSQATCEQMKASQQTYTQTANDPSASRAGDEQMSCDQILAELKQQQYTAPDKAKVAEAQATASKERSMLASQQAQLNREAVAENAAVQAAAASDRLTEAATMGMVNTHKAAAVAEAIQQKKKVEGEAMAAERRPTEQKMTAQTGDFAAGAAQQLTTNPRLARLMQLANARHCHGG